MDKPRAGEKTTKERIHRLKSVLEGDPASVAFFPLSKVLYSAGAVDEAVQVLERGLAYHPEFVAARLDLAHIYHQTGRDDNAINQLEKAVSLDLYNVNALKELVVILMEQGFKKEAVRYLSRLQELDPENEQYQEWMEKASSETEPEAVTVAAEKPQPPTTSEFNTLTMVDIYMKQGLWKKAAEVLKAIIAHNPDNREAQQKLAEINAELDKMQTGEPEEEPKPSKTSWEAEETVPLASTGTREKDTAELLLDKWEEFRDLIATSGASAHKPEIEEKPVKPLITDEELERFAASIANITEEGLTAQPRSEEMDWEGIVTAEEKPSIRLESGYEAMAVDYSETQPAADKPEPTTDLSSLPRIEDFAPLESRFPLETDIAPIPVPIVEEGTRLEELTSPELLSSPDLVEMVAHTLIPPIEEAPFVEELPAPELQPTAKLAEPPVLAPIPTAEDESRLEGLSTPEIIPTFELEELIAPAPTPDAEELSALEELTAPELLPSAGLAEFSVPAPLPPLVEESRLEELTAPESFAAPALDDLTVSAPPPIADSTFRLEDLTAPETMASLSLEALEEPATPIPTPLEDIVPPEEALTLEGPPSLDDIVRPPDPPKTDKLESIDDLLGTTSASTLPAPPPPAQAPGEEEFPEFEDWLDRLKDQNA